MPLPPPGELRKYYVPEVVFGEGALDLCGRYAANLGARRVLLVGDRGVEAAGWTGMAADALRRERLDVASYFDVSPNPREAEVQRGVDLYQRAGCNVIVAVGGGSVIDCAKGIAILAGNGGAIGAYKGIDEIPLPGPPLVAVPTTCGSAADVSQFAVVLDVGSGTKYVLASRKIVPDVSLTDPRVVATLPPSVAGAVGMDALSHALEACCSNAGWALTTAHALSAMRRVAAALPRFVADRGDRDAAAQMMLASMEAGFAFSNASLGLVHAMAHPLGGVLDLPHGLCNARLLAAVVAYNFPAAREEYARAAEALGVETRDDEDAWRAEFLDRIERLAALAGSRRALAEGGLKREDAPLLAERALRDVCIVTNPRRPSAADVAALYEQVC